MLDWMDDLEHKLQLRAILSEIMFVGVAKGVLVDYIFEIANREVDEASLCRFDLSLLLRKCSKSTAHNTLFRGNSILTKTIELFMAFHGKAFLEASIGSPIRRLCSEKVAIEVDPTRSGKSSKDIERDLELLIYWCKEFWNQIYSARGECPKYVPTTHKS